MEVQGQRSRFFHKDLRADRKKTSDSSYFTRSPSSAFGAVHSLGPWLPCLANHRGENIVCSKSPGDSDSCEACRPVIQAAVQQFWACPYFVKGWKESSAASDGESSSLVCWRGAEARIHRCVRHLCPQRCYMRAYSPCREWFTLRKRLREESSFSVDNALTGWLCVLLPVTDDYLPRVSFSDPDGKLHNSQSQALRRLHSDTSPSPSQLHLKNSQARDPNRIGTMRPVALSFGSQKHISEKKKRKPNTATYVTTDSPFGLLEELFVEDPWKLLISTIFLNRTSRVQVDSVLYEFFRRWPSPDKVSANASTTDIASLIQPMGIAQKRATGIIRFSKDYLALLARKAAVADDINDENIASRRFSRDDILSLYNCGDYAAAAYKLFIQKDYWSEEPCDHALRAYASYQRSLSVVQRT